MPKLIIGLDAGPEKSAMLLLDPQRPQILDLALCPNKDILLKLKALRASIDSDNLVLVIEQLKSYGMPAGDSVLNTCVWNGRFIEAWVGESTRKYFMVTRKTVVTELCGSPRANDANVRRALIDRYSAQGLYGPEGEFFCCQDARSASKRIELKGGPLYKVKKDLWSALAIATTHTDIKRKEADEALKDLLG